ncbi:lipocalin [Vibrio sp. T187]|uniref:lipocalin family protein n=1 Tax=Vibrio TaxID=662 RepID=UPI0010C98353|nr:MULTISPECIES: lipocalin family protein [Vibrio]MBW3697730.1 lipocalin [Vibrio sp. T187]
MRKVLVLLTLLSLSGCLGMPKTIEPVNNFKLNQYLGKWYEIARLDHSFERGLSHVTAEYAMREDGGVSVLNKGYSANKDEWKEAIGKAYFVDSTSDGYLKVSFFGPFYGSYVVFELEQSRYDYAFVSGPNNDYLWLLSRTPTVSQEVIEKFESLAEQNGFDIEQLIYVEQK